MLLSWFCIWQADEVKPLSPYERSGLEALLLGCPDLRAGHILTPADAHDPYFPAHGGSPSLIVQAQFDEIDVLENNLRRGGYLSALTEPGLLRSLHNVKPSQQTMLTRRLPVAGDRSFHGMTKSLSYWVEYTGPAEDENAWHEFYLDSHTPLLGRLPGIRAIEIYTPAVAVCGLHLPERRCMQRNKTVFDSAEAMDAAMKSPVREMLREDVTHFPPFSGAAHHFPFESISWWPDGAGLARGDQITS